MKNNIPAQVVNTNVSGGDKYSIDVMLLTPGINARKQILRDIPPINQNFVLLPLEGEIVNLTTSIDGGHTTLNPQENLYYTGVISNQQNLTRNILSTPHPKNTNPTQIQPTVKLAENGVITKTPPQETLSLSNNNFQLNIPKLYPYPGDILIQGRLGGSIRFTSTQKETQSFPKLFTPRWKKGVSNLNSPLTIISNTFPSPEENYRTEDINKDLSSIYLTAGQDIGLNLSCLSLFQGNVLFDGDNRHIPTQKTITPEIILNSGRLVLNSYAKDITLSAKESLNIGANNKAIIRSGQLLALDSPKIYLGYEKTKHPLLEEPIIKGESFRLYFGRLISILKTMCDINPDLQQEGIKLMSLYREFDEILSNKVFTE